MLAKNILSVVPEGLFDEVSMKPRVIALLIDTDVLLYDTFILAIMRAGFIVRVLSFKLYDL